MLSSGIDSLYLSFRGELRPEVGDLLAELKELAREGGQGQLLQLSGVRKAVVQPAGWGRYRYWLRCDGFDAFIGSGDSLPAAYVQVRSSLLHEVGPENALTEVGLFVDGPLLSDIDGVCCSRVDIYSDFQGWIPQPADYTRFVVRSRKNTWHMAFHHDGRNFTGFTFGRDAMVARLYDKGLEIKQSGKDWMLEVWGNTLETSQPVWRLEFQLRRQMLKECRLEEPNDVIEQRERLWHYGMRWVSLRQSSSSTRRVRWPVDNVWLQLAESWEDTPVSPLVRQRIKMHDESVLVRGLAGYASSLAAISGISDLDVTMAVCRRRMAEYLKASGRDFRDLVLAKRERT